MIGYKLSLADIILYYGLHRYLVRERDVVCAISYVCVYEYRQEWHFTRKQVLSMWADGLTRYVLLYTSMNILLCRNIWRPLPLFITGSAFPPSEAICAATGGFSQEPRHVDSLMLIIRNQDGIIIDAGLKQFFVLASLFIQAPPIKH